MTMPAIDTLLQQPAAQAVGWALLQFVWQGAAIGVLTAVALAALRRSASDIRYVVATIGLALMLTLPIVTGVQNFASLRNGTDPAATAVLGADESRVTTAAVGLRESRTSPRSAAAGVAPQAAWTARAIAQLREVRVEPVLPTVMLVWLIGVSFLSLRLLTGWLWVQR